MRHAWRVRTVRGMAQATVRAVTRQRTVAVPECRDRHRREPHQADDQQHHKHALTVSTRLVVRHLTWKLLAIA